MLFVGEIIFAQQVNPFYIGHSLVNFDMPAMVAGLAENAGKTSSYDQQIINGSPLQYNYNNHATAQGTSYRTAFPNGGFNHLIVTEAIPLKGHLQYSDTYLFANNFYEYAKNNNNNIPVKYFIYETWHCTTTGTPTGCSYDNDDSLLWQPRLAADFPLWTGIVTSVRNEFPNDNIWMIPAGQALYKLNTRINNGTLPGITSFTDLFYDDIHLTNKGNYFVACVMYATLFKQSPFGLTTALNTKYGNAFSDMPTAQQAQIMQQVAWETVTELSSWTGVTQNLSTTKFENNQKIEIYPNPAKNQLFVNNTYSKDATYEVYNNIGKQVKMEKLNGISIDISDLQSGLYILKIKTEGSEQIQKFIKQE